MGSPIGIDLGTSNTVAAAWVGEGPVVLPNAVGQYTTPSMVAIEQSTGQVLVGATAQRRAIVNPRGTIFSVKRLLGQRFEQVASQGRYLPYELVCGEDGDAMVRVGGLTLAPGEIAAFLFRQVIDDAKAFLRDDVAQAVVTVPAYFDDRQKRAMRAAAELAGLEVCRIVNEPTAAALAYGLAGLENDTRLAVVHLGGGTLDVSIVEVGDGVCAVQAVCGDACLGGDDFDQVIIDWTVEELRRKYGMEATADASLMAMVKWEAERAKCELSTRMTAELVLPCVRPRASGDDATLSLALRRTEFEDRSRALLERIAGPCRQALADAHTVFRQTPVDHVILVGQQTRMPSVQRAVAEVFGRQARCDIDPAQTVARGAAVQGAILGGQYADQLLLDVIPLSLGIATSGGEFRPLVRRNTVIPTETKEIFTTTLDDQTELTVQVFQGEHPMADDNLLIGAVTLRGIPAARHGVP